MLDASAFVGGIGPSCLSVGNFAANSKINPPSLPPLGARTMRVRDEMSRSAHASHGPCPVPDHDASFLGQGLPHLQPRLRGERRMKGGFTALYSTKTRQSSGLDVLVRLLGAILNVTRSLFVSLFAKLTRVAARAVGKAVPSTDSARMQRRILQRSRKNLGGGGGGGGSSSSSSSSLGSGGPRTRVGRDPELAYGVAAVEAAAAAQTSHFGHSSSPGSLSQTAVEHSDVDQERLKTPTNIAKLSLDQLLETSYGGVKASLQEAKAMEMVRDCVLELGDKERSTMSTQWLDGLGPVDMLRYMMPPSPS
jgi:hypothetical protein